jgi:cytochrome P450
VAGKLVSDVTAVLGLTVSTIHAGSDTTSNTLGMFLRHVLRHHDKLAKLKTEFKTANLSDRLSFGELNKLRYLDTSIKESMRLDTLAQDPFERVVSAPGQEIDGTWTPGGTTVSVSSHVIHHDPAIWETD